MAAPLALIAGSGPAPVKAAHALKRAGRAFFVIALTPFASKELDAFPHRRMGQEDVAAILAEIKKQDCRDLVFAGGIARVGGDVESKMHLPEQVLPFLSQAGRGDGALIAGLVHWLEGEGFRILGVDEICEELQAKEGLLAGAPPDEAQKADIELAARAARAIGALDAGQAVVACHRVVLALEAREGTAAMLVRVAELPAFMRGTPERRAGVLVKLPRPEQDLRIDMPAIGVESVRLAAKAGLAGIAVEAGRVLLLDGAAEIAAAAEEAGMFVLIAPAGTFG